MSHREGGRLMSVFVCECGGGGGGGGGQRSEERRFMKHRDTTLHVRSHIPETLQQV